MKVVLKDLTKKFSGQGKNAPDVIAVNNFNVEIPDGKLIGLLGPSGCGKSTALNLISGLLSPTAGRIFFGEDDVTDLPPENRGVGLVFQNYALYPHLTVKQNILFPLQNLKGEDKLSKEEMLARAYDAAKLVQIEGLMDRKPKALSGGQQQRVAIARALVKMPRVLLLDEPLGALDLKLRKGMQIELKRMQQKLGITFIYVTHDQEEALTMSDTIVVMNEGVIQQIGTPADIYNEPKNVFVAKFIGESNIIPGVMLEDYRVRFHDIDFECVDAGFGCNTPVDVVVRPEDIDIMPLGKTALKGTIKSVLFMGVHYEFRIETGSFTWTVHSTDYVAPDTEISLEIVPDAIHIMHKSLKHDEQELLTEDEIADAAAAAEEE